jgi:AcrR family transcriptional regulator
MTNQLVGSEPSSLPPATPRIRRQAGESRRHILEAGVAVLQEKGIRAFTLDAVAKKAGISKAGVIHHFPTKDALAQELIASAFREMEQLRIAAASSEPEGTPGRWTRAYIKASFQTLECSAGSMVHLYELAAAQPELLQHVSNCMHQCWQCAQNDGIDPVTALTVMMATDGCVQEVVFGLSPCDAPHLQQIRKRLIDMTKLAAPARRTPTKTTKKR